MHLDGSADSLTVSTVTDVLAVLDGTARYFVISDLERSTYPPSTDLSSQRIEFPSDEISPDFADAAPDAYRR